MNIQDIQNKIQNGESFIIANDGQFLGKLTLNAYDAESVSNPYGIYGSQYSATSIFNQYGVYGSPYSSLSPYNPFTSTPPVIYLRGQYIGFLTRNRFLGLISIAPEQLSIWLSENNLTY